MDRRSLAFAAIAGAIATSVTVSASADEPAVVRVVVPACDGAAFDIEAFARAITLELRAGGVAQVDILSDRSAAGPTTVATINVDAEPCTAQAKALELSIVDELTSKTVRRRLTVDDMAPGARARVVALAAAELLRASWSELRLRDAPAGALPVPPSVRLATMAAEPPAEPPPPEPVTPPEPTPLPPVAREPFLRTDLAIEGRFFPTYGSTLLGPDIAVSLGLTDRVPVRVRVDAAALFGTSYDPLGSIAVDLVAGGVAVTLARHTGPLDVEVGPRMELGWGHASGSGSSAATLASSGSTYVVDASAMIALRLSLGGAYSASFGADLGGVVHGLDAAADGRRAAGFGGPVAGVAIGVGRSF